MGKKQWWLKWQGLMAIAAPVLLNGCVSAVKSQERFTEQACNSPATEVIAAVTTVVLPAHISIAAYVLLAIVLIVSAIGGHFIVAPYVKEVKRYLNLKTQESNVTAIIGCIERAIYTVSFLVGWYFVIIILLALKIGQVIVTCLGLDTKKAGKIVNAYMLGNLLSLGAAILVGIIAKQLFLKF